MRILLPIIGTCCLLGAWAATRALPPAYHARARGDHQSLTCLSSSMAMVAKSKPTKLRPGEELPEELSVSEGAPEGITPEPSPEDARTEPLVYATFRGEPLGSAVAAIAASSGRVIVLAPGIEERVTVTFDGTPLREAVETLADLANLIVREVESQLLLERPPRVAMEFHLAEAAEVISLLAKQAGVDVRVVIDPDVVGELSIQLDDVPWAKALDACVKKAGFHLITEDHGRLLRVMSAEGLRRQMEPRVYRLEYLHPEDEYLTPHGYGYADTGFGSSARRSTLDVLRGMLSGQSGDLPIRGSLEYHPDGNWIDVCDRRDVREQIASILQLLDVPPDR